MIRRFSTLAASFLCVILVSAKQEAPEGQAQKRNAPNQTDAAFIENSGSTRTNTPGYRLSINPSGEAEWTLFRRRNSAVVPRAKAGWPQNWRNNSLLTCAG